VALAFAAALIYLPALQGVFGTAALSPGQLATVVPFPFIVWGADEIRRLLIRRYRGRRLGDLHPARGSAEVAAPARAARPPLGLPGVQPPAIERLAHERARGQQRQP